MEKELRGLNPRNPLGTRNEGVLGRLSVNSQRCILTLSQDPAVKIPAGHWRKEGEMVSLMVLKPVAPGL